MVNQKIEKIQHLIFLLHLTFTPLLMSQITSLTNLK